MASCSSLVVFICLVTTMHMFCTQRVIGTAVTCKDLDRHTCAFAVSSSGTRCVLERQVTKRGTQYTCRESRIEADKLRNWIESDECIKACGLHRETLGISSDYLLEPQFAQKLCSPPCYDTCPNIVDLYFNLAAGEGVYLPKLCESQGMNARRQMAEIKSSGMVAPGPVVSLIGSLTTPAPSPQPMLRKTIIVMPPV